MPCALKSSILLKVMKMKSKVKVILGILAVLVITIACSLYFLFDQVQAKGDHRETIFTVSLNDSGKDVFNNLESEGIIKNADIAYYYARVFEDIDFKAGDYEINSDMSVSKIVSYLNDATNALVDTVSITFPEGDWLKDYAEKLAEVTDVSSEELLTYWNDKEVIRSYMNEYPFLTEEIFNDDSRYYLEGYLFPNTYEFYRDTDPDAITRRFLDQTLSIYQQYAEAFQNSSLSIHEIFTLASIVQYEAAKPQDMKTIASVFLNRLAIDMPLQSSVTVCYAMDIDKENDSWTMCEYNPDFDSPYNTYMYYGLPPGPILNPGLDALVAVLEPENTDYYFFMADVCGDGTVYYSEDFATHQAYIDEYLTCY